MLLNLVKKSVLFFLFLLCLYCIVLCAGCTSNESLNHLHRVRLRKNLEALQYRYSVVCLKFSRDMFFKVSFSLHRAMYRALCEKSSQPLPL